MSNDFANCLSLSHKSCDLASLSAGVISSPPVITLSTMTCGVYVYSGCIDEPSKWFQNSFTLMASWKWTEKIAQFMPLASSLGIDDGRVSESEVVVTVVI